jgi:FeS assembly SUF system regulator
VLKLSKLTDYASVIAVSLAKKAEGSRSAAEISSDTGIAYPTVSKILKILTEANVVVSQRGAHGGYALSRLPHLITLKELITAMDGRRYMTECCSLESQCSHVRRCGVKGNWKIINEVLNLFFQKITLQDMSCPLDLPLLMTNISNLCLKKETQNDESI